MKKAISIPILLLLVPGAFVLLINGESAAPGIWDDTNFNGGATYNVDVLADGTIRLSSRDMNVENDLTSMNGIESLDNLSIDQMNGEIEVIKDTILFGGSESDYGRACEPTSDGGFIIAGSTYSEGNGGSDVWLIKTDGSGVEQWSRTYGGSNNDFGRDVKQTSDGGYIITGYTFSKGSGNHDVWLIKTDNAGNRLWDETYGGGGYEYGEGVSETSDGGYIIVGSDYHDWEDPWSELYLIKTDADGDEVWDEKFGDQGDFSWGYDVKQTSDGGYISIGYTESYGNGRKDIWLIKTDGSGHVTWHETYGGSNFERGYHVLEEEGGDLILLGYTSSYGNGGQDAWLIRTDPLGNVEWDREYGGEKDDSGYMVRGTDDGGYIITGGTWSFGNGNRDIWLIKTDSEGNRIWDKTYGGTTTDYAESVVQTANGEYVIIGTSYSYGAGEYDLIFLNTDELGNPLFVEGHLISSNILQGEASFIDVFRYFCDLPIGTNISVRFSRDLLRWYDSGGTEGSYDEMEDGFNDIDLTALGWNSSAFYYHMLFSAPGADSPILKTIFLQYQVAYTSGHFDSNPMDNGDDLVSWKRLLWSGSEYPGTSINFQLRSSPNLDTIGDEDFMGSDGTRHTYYNSSGMDIWKGHDNERWMQYRAYLATENTSKSPIIDEVQLTFNTLSEVDVETPLAVRSGDVPINYTLYDGEGDEVAIVVQYRIGFSMYTQATPKNGTLMEGLSSSPEGTSHVFVWDSLSDLGNIASDDIFIRIIPQDEETGMGDETVGFTVDNKPPVFISVLPTGAVNSEAVTLVAETDGNAYLRWDENNRSYENMANQFGSGEGGHRHSTVVKASLGENTFFISARDPFGNSIPYGIPVTFFVDTGVPADAYVLINNGDEYARYPVVNLTVNGSDDGGSGIYMMRVSTDEYFSGVDWIPYRVSLWFNLTPGDGVKAVYVSLMDRAGNIVTLQDTIIIDTVPPKILTVGPTTEQNTTAVRITAETNEKANLRWSLTDTDYRSMDMSFELGQGATIHYTTINASEGNNTFYLSAEDMNGNVMNYSVPVSFSVKKKGGNPRNGGNNGDKEFGSIAWWLWILILLVINLILFIPLVMMKRRARRDKDVTPIVTSTSGSGKEELIRSLHGRPGKTGGYSTWSESYGGQYGGAYGNQYALNPASPYAAERGPAQSPPPMYGSSAPPASLPVQSYRPEQLMAGSLQPVLQTQPLPSAPVTSTKLALATPRDERAPVAVTPPEQTKYEVPPPPVRMEDLEEIWNPPLRKKEQEEEKAEPGEDDMGTKADTPMPTPKKLQSWKIQDNEKKKEERRNFEEDLEKMMSELKSEIPLKASPRSSRRKRPPRQEERRNKEKKKEKKKSVTDISKSLDDILGHFEKEEEDEREMKKETKQALATIPIRRIAISRKRDEKY